MPNPQSGLRPKSSRKLVAVSAAPRLAEEGEFVAAAKAKAHLLQLLDKVANDRKPITITKRGRIVAQLVPPPEEEKISNFDRVFGSMRGTGRVIGDIVSPDWEAWGPEWR